MGKSNRKASLESKIALLMGEHETTRAEIIKAERSVERLPTMRERLWEIETLVNACEAIIKSDHPGWTRDHIKASRPFVHKIPVRFGWATKLALDVLRVSGERMLLKDITIEVLCREGCEYPTTETISKVANTIGNSFAKKWKTAPGAYIDTDCGCPAQWWSVKPT